MRQQDLESELQSLVSKPSNIQVRSHVQYDRILSCATFLTHEALRVPNSGSDLEIKEDFVGLTPLYDPGPSKALVEYAQMSSFVCVILLIISQYCRRSRPRHKSRDDFSFKNSE